jgi:ABC-type multidrug transport system ATPase subunit
VPLVEGLSCVAHGDRVGLVGDASALFAVLGGRASVVAGRVLVAGHAAETAVGSGVVGLLGRSPCLPETWTVDQYLIEAERLSGASRGAARDSARRALETLSLAHLWGRRLGTLTAAERRLVGLALALSDEPPVVAVEDPVSDLDDRGVELVAGALEHATRGRRLVLSTASLPGLGAERALFDGADVVVLIAGGAVVRQGPFEALTRPGTSYLVSVTRRGRELMARLAAAGADVVDAGAGAASAADPTAAATGGSRLFVDLPAHADTRAIVQAALEVEAPIVGLVPLSTSSPD